MNFSAISRRNAPSFRQDRRHPDATDGTTRQRRVDELSRIVDSAKLLSLRLDSRFHAGMTVFSWQLADALHA